MGRHTKVKIENKKKKKETKKLKIKNIIIIIFIIMFGGIALYSGYKILNYTKDTVETKDEIEELNEFIKVDDNTGEVKIDFNQLKEKNSDTVGWLRIKDTNIDYPVVKGKDNDYYLTHNFKKNFNASGWLFADYKNKINGKDKNIVIYGHSMKNKTMFGELSKVLRKEWYSKDDNLNITFITPDKKATYKVFSIYKIEAEDYYINTEFSTDKDFDTFVKVLKNRSQIKLNVDVNNPSQIMTLSTCYDNGNIRLAVHAIKVNEEINEL